MKKLILLITILFAGICTAQFTQQFNDFSKIKIDTDAEVEIVYSTKSQVIFNKNEEELKGLSITNDSNSLIIMNNSKTNIPELKIRIYTNNLEALSVEGKTAVTLSRFKYQDRMVIYAKKGASINTGDTIIKSLQIDRSTNSSVICINAKDKNEIVDGELIAAN